MTSLPSIGVIQAADRRKLSSTVFSYKWVIENFGNTVRRTAGTSISSPIFSTNYSSTQDWKICISLYRAAGTLQLAIELIGLSESSLPGTDVIKRLSILNGLDQEIKCGSDLCHWAYADQVFAAVADHHKLTVVCKLRFDTDARTLKRKEENEAETPCRVDMCNDYEKLLEEGMCSDVIIIADGKKFNVHKTILMARSPVFRAMFEHNMKENVEKAVEIKDVKCDVLKELLRFMYAGKVNGIEVMAEDLLIVAEKYSVQGLKVVCEQFLSENLTVDNVLVYLRLADMNNAMALKSGAIQFFASNSEDIVDTPEFTSFGNSNSALLCEIVRAAMGRRKK